MAKSISKLLEWVGRLIKGLIGLLLIVPLITMGIAVLDQLSAIPVGSRSLAGWAVIGSWSYLGVHLLFYKPTTLFRTHHRMLSKLAIGLFGGQVSTATPAGGGEKPKARGKARAERGGESSQGSTLLVLSPYLIPLYTLLVCVGSWISRRWWESTSVELVTGLLLGASLTMHWVMTADDLQQDRDRFPLDAYLPALAIIGLISLFVVCLCLPLAVPGFSPPSVLTDTFVHSKAVYLAAVRTLFF